MSEKVTVKNSEELFNKLRKFEKTYGFSGILSSLVQNDVELYTDDIEHNFREANSIVRTKIETMRSDFKSLSSELRAYLKSCDRI